MTADDIGSSAYLDISNYIDGADRIIAKTEEMRDRINSISDSLRDPIPLTVETSSVEKAEEKLNDLKDSRIYVEMESSDALGQMEEIKPAVEGGGGTVFGLDQAGQAMVQLAENGVRDKDMAHIK